MARGRPLYNAFVRTLRMTVWPAPPDTIPPGMRMMSRREKTRRSAARHSAAGRLVPAAMRGVSLRRESPEMSSRLVKTSWSVVVNLHEIAPLTQARQPVLLPTPPRD